MARINSFSREVKLWVSENMSPAARQKLAATIARKLLGEAQAQNKKVLGKVPSHKQVVDGRIGAPLESVNPDRGRILFEFELVTDLLAWVRGQLVLHSPVGTAPEDPHPGLYQRSHRLLADGVEIDPDGKIPPATEYLIINIQPYARKIERGHSRQAPEGVYEVVADLARRRFGNIAKIRYTMVGISDSGASSLWDWAVANASRAEGSAKQRRQYEKNIRQPAIRITLK